MVNTNLLHSWNVQTFVASQQLESATWHPSGQQLMSSHNDGSYIIWRVNEDEGKSTTKSEPSASTPYGPFPCKAINKILWNESDESVLVFSSSHHLARVLLRRLMLILLYCINREELDIIAFSGGMPRASYGDRHTVSVLKGDKTHVTFDLTSKVMDFCLVHEADSKKTEALVVLAEEELIVIDLISPGWPAYASPYLASLHCSAITAQTAVTVTTELYEKIISHPQMLAPSVKISSRPWPINGGLSEAQNVDPSATKLLLLTGHEVRNFPLIFPVSFGLGFLKLIRVCRGYAPGSRSLVSRWLLIFIAVGRYPVAGN